MVLTLYKHFRFFGILAQEILTIPWLLHIEAQALVSSTLRRAPPPPPQGIPMGKRWIYLGIGI